MWPPSGSWVPSSGTELLLAAATFCLAFWVLWARRPRVPPGLQSPPGPWGWPLLGHALALGRAPHEALARLSGRYGPVLQVRLGRTPVVVLGGAAAIRQALVHQADDFKGRPALHTFSLVADGQSMAFGPDSGPVWAARRRLAQSALRSFSVASDPGAACCYLEAHVAHEAEELVGRFQALMAGHGRFEPYQYLVVAVTNVICAICFGRRYDHEDQELLGLIDLGNEFGEAAASGNLVDFFPVLRYLPNRALRSFRAVNDRFCAFVQKIVRDHDRTFEKGHIRDVTDSLLEHCQDKQLDENANVRLSDEKVVSVLMDLFGAGFDTVTSALSWSLLYLVTQPTVQGKIQRELDAVVGRARRPTLSDRPKMPYLEAFILETFRHSSFIPFTIPHSTTRATTLNGFYIPKGTCVFVNQWQVNHDPQLWGDPDAFRPERFVGPDGRVDRACAEQVLLFGLGRRRCVGEGLARAELFLFLALLLQRLEFSLAEGASVDPTPIYGLTMKHARCPYYQARLRGEEAAA